MCHYIYIQIIQIVSINCINLIWSVVEMANLLSSKNIHLESNCLENMVQHISRLHGGKGYRYEFGMQSEK